MSPFLERGRRRDRTDMQKRRSNGKMRSKSAYFRTAVAAAAICAAMVPSPSSAATLTHRWSFAGDYSDSVGTSHGFTQRWPSTGSGDHPTDSCRVSVVDGRAVLGGGLLRGFQLDVLRLGRGDRRARCGPRPRHHARHRWRIRVFHARRRRAPGGVLFVGMPECARLPAGWAVSVGPGGAKLVRDGFSVRLRKP